ncbi:MAG: hypothetical protein J2P25_24975 [Nocardiopsaceae bacterium]|nr:hypothetical protein [Nocardiopsaceae bacterium]
MPVPSTPQDSSALIVLILFIAAMCVIYWRLAIRLFVIITIALAIYGVTGLHI